MGDLTGTFVLGVFDGVDDERYPTLYVQAGERRVRIDYRPFDPMTGASTLPVGLAVGDRVAVRVFVDARGYKDKNTGEPKVFASMRALEVVRLGQEQL